VIILQENTDSNSVNDTVTVQFGAHFHWRVVNVWNA